MQIPQGAIPQVGLGTFGLTGDAGVDAIGAAIDAGYRHLDTAQSYGTEENVGRGIAQSGLDRSEFFVTTKITADNCARLIDSLRDSLRVMDLDYADLTLIHWPAPHDRVPVSSYIGDLARAEDLGLTRLIGVSNFTRRHIDEAQTEIGEGRLATNQFERHIYLQNDRLADHCGDAGIAVTAYMPLGGGRLFDDPVLARLGRKHAATPNQIALAFLLQLGSIVIPKSATPARQKSNLAAAALTLDGEDMAELRELDRGERYIDPEWGPKWD